MELGELLSHRFVTAPPQQCSDASAATRPTDCFGCRLIACVDEGIITVTPKAGEHNAWFSQTSGFLLNTMEAVGAWPEWAPANETHFLRSDSVVTSINYDIAPGSDELLRYSVYDGPTVDRVRVAQAIVSSAKEFTVTTDGQLLPRRSSCVKPCGEWWELERSTGVVEIAHHGSAEVSISVA